MIQLIEELVISLLLAIPVIILAIQGTDYWKDFIAGKKSAGKTSEKTTYPKPYFQLYIFGVLLMWFTWITGIITTLMNSYESFLGDFKVPIGQHTGPLIAVIGLLVFYSGSVLYIMTLHEAKNNLRPAPSGITKKHDLVMSGTFSIIRHPLYVSYLLITTGLFFVLLFPLILLPVILQLVGIYPMAKAEEELLVERFGDDYGEYKRKTGMLIPKFLTTVLESSDSTG